MILDLILKDVKDPYIQENFFRLRKFIDEQVIFDGDFKLFDISIPQAEPGLAIPHGLTFIPADIIPLGFQGNGNFYFRYQEFDRENMYVTTVGPTRIRFLAGKLKDPVRAALNDLTVDPYPFVAPGDVIAPASPGFVFSAVNAKSDLFWLTSEGIPSNVVGVPILFANARVIQVAVGTQSETNYTIGIYQHEGKEVGLTQIGTFEITGGGFKRFDVDFPTIPSTNAQLACRIISGDTTDLKVSLVVKGAGA